VDISRYLDWIKLSPRYLLPIALFTGFALFAPSDWLEVFGLADWIERYRPFFGLVCLASTVLLLSSGIMAIYDWGKGRREEAQQMKQMRKSLHELSEPEKEVLREFVHNGTTTEYFRMSDGVVGGLRAKGILYRPTNLSRGHDIFAYNVLPWAWEYLNSHPKLLE
jgi:hypothetical protein